MENIVTKTEDNIYCALVKAQNAAQAVAKDSTNSFHRYKYASAEALIAESREALSAAGLALINTGWKFIPELGENSTVSGRMEVYYRLGHVTGEYLDFSTSSAVIPEKGRPQDKAEATALTYNLGYFLRGLLLLPREDETTSVDARDDRNHKPAKTVYKTPSTTFPPKSKTEMLSVINSATLNDNDNIRQMIQAMPEGQDKAEVKAAYVAKFKQLQATP